MNIENPPLTFWHYTVVRATGTLLEKMCAAVLYDVIRGRVIADPRKNGNTVAEMARATGKVRDQSGSSTRSGVE